LERSPVVFSLLEDGLRRARAEGDMALREVIARIDLRCEEASDYLSSVELHCAPDVVVIDPMFPPSKKSALVKKDMRAFHSIVGPDRDSAQLLQAAYRAAVHRVVVKRPKKADFLAGEKPNISIEGKSIRFDIYTKKAFPKS
jgi:16S rRNA (guanine1516-N2)-methyltransferase